MFLVSLELGGALRMPSLPYMRVGSHIPLLAVLALVFVIPHDPSARVKPDQVGADGYVVAPAMANRRWAPQGPAQKPIPEPRVVMRYARLLARRTSGALEAGLAEVGLAAPAPPLPQVDSGCNFTTVEELRSFYGERQNWWGDFDARQTRKLYHSLLPTRLLEDECPLPVADRARLAVAARRAARLYARERGFLPVTVACQLLDGMRAFTASGQWQPDGLSEEQIFSKYARQCGVSVDHCDDVVYYTILRKSCTSNLHVDAVMGLSQATGVAEYSP